MKAMRGSGRVHGKGEGSEGYRIENSNALASYSSRSRIGISPRSFSCSGRRLRLPGDPVSIEKFAVVGEMFPDEADL